MNMCSKCGKTYDVYTKNGDMSQCPHCGASGSSSYKLINNKLVIGNPPVSKSETIQVKDTPWPSFIGLAAGLVFENIGVILGFMYCLALLRCVSDYILIALWILVKYVVLPLVGGTILICLFAYWETRE